MGARRHVHGYQLQMADAAPALPIEPQLIATETISAHEPGRCTISRDTATSTRRAATVYDRDRANQTCVNGKRNLTRFRQLNFDHLRF
jgi:hypothetical protein